MKIIISIYILLALVLSGCGFSPKQIEGFNTDEVVWRLCGLEGDPLTKGTNYARETKDNLKNSLKERGIINYTCISFWGDSYSYETQDEFCTNEPNSGGVFVGEAVCTKKVAEQSKEPKSKASQEQLDKIIL